MVTLRYLILGACLVVVVLSSNYSRVSSSSPRSRNVRGSKIELFSHLTPFDFSGRNISRALAARQEECEGTPCLGGCCEVGDICVTSHPDKPCCANLCSSGACCNPDACCPKGPEGCCNPPKTCCGTKYCCDPGYFCCADENGCCPDDWTCCGDDGCCKPGDKCCAGGLCCSVEETCCGDLCCKAGAYCDEGNTCRWTTSSVSSESSTSATATSQKTSPTASSTLSTPKIKSSSTSTCSDAGLQNRAAATGICAPRCPTPTPVATIVFTYTTTVTPIYPSSVLATATNLPNYLDNSRLLQNMCNGMKNMMGSLPSSQSVTLTYHGDRNIQRRNRRAMCSTSIGGASKSICKKVIQDRNGNLQYYPSYLGEDLLNVWYLEMECDEFPFASTCEGGNSTGGSTWCVSKWENNWQSGMMTSHLGLITPGDRYVVRIGNDWDCQTGKPRPRQPRKRDDLFTNSFEGNELFLNMFGVGTNAMTLYLDDLDAGSYYINLNVTQGHFDSSTVVDYLGENYAKLSGFPPANNSNQKLSFSLSDAVDGLRLIALTSQTQVDVSYSVANSTTTGPAATTSTRASSAPKLHARWLSYMSVALAWILL